MNTLFFIDLLLKRLDIGNSPCLDLLNHLLISIGGSQTLLEGKPLLKQEAGLLRLELLAGVHADGALLATL